MKRIIEKKVKKLWNEKSVVVMDGYPKTGKTMIAKNVAERYFDFSQLLVQQALLSDESLFDGADTIAIDHVELESDTGKALLENVAEKEQRFLIVSDSLCEEKRDVRVYPYAIEERELGEEAGIHLSQLGRDAIDGETKKNITDVMTECFRLGLPSYYHYAERRMKREANQWIESVIERGKFRNPKQVRQWLALMAEASGTTVSQAILRQGRNLPSRPTLDRYNDYLNHHLMVPLQSRLLPEFEDYQVKNARYFLVDSMLMISVLKITSSNINSYQSKIGAPMMLRPLILTLIHQTLLTYADIMNNRLSCYEDYRKKNMIDFILEDDKRGYLIQLQLLGETANIDAMRWWQEVVPNKEWTLVVITLENSAYTKNGVHYIPLSLLRY